MPTLRRILIAALAVLVVAITLSYYILEWKNILQIQEAIDKSKAIMDEKRNSVRNYREKVAFYKTQEGIEHLAREQYNLIASGERVILLRSPDTQPDF